MRMLWGIANTEVRGWEPQNKRECWVMVEFRCYAPGESDIAQPRTNQKRTSKRAPEAVHPAKTGQCRLTLQRQPNRQAWITAFSVVDTSPLPSIFISKIRQRESAWLGLSADLLFTPFPPMVVALSRVPTPWLGTGAWVGRARKSSPQRRPSPLCGNMRSISLMMIPRALYNKLKPVSKRPRNRWVALHTNFSTSLSQSRDIISKMTRDFHPPWKWPALTPARV